MGVRLMPGAVLSSLSSVALGEPIRPIADVLDAGKSLQHSCPISPSPRYSGCLLFGCCVAGFQGPR